MTIFKLFLATEEPEWFQTLSRGKFRIICACHDLLNFGFDLQAEQE